MTSVGETLRRARLKRNIELNRVADELKISATMLKAIEEEHFEKLPSGVFARSFVRQYARLLEVDEREILEELARVLEPPPVPEPVAGDPVLFHVIVYGVVPPVGAALQLVGFPAVPATQLPLSTIG